MLGFTMNDKCSTWAIPLAFYIKESQELRCLFNSTIYKSSHNLSPLHTDYETVQEFAAISLI
jgi:hypothetical protein